MERSHLKLFAPTATHRDSSAESLASVQTRVVGEARVAVAVGDIIPLLAEAWQSKRAWLSDFASERVIVSQDLYEVLLAYKRVSQDKAA